MAAATSTDGKEKNVQNSQSAISAVSLASQLADLDHKRFEEVYSLVCKEHEKRKLESNDIKIVNKLTKDQMFGTLLYLAFERICTKKCDKLLEELRYEINNDPTQTGTDLANYKLAYNLPYNDPACPSLTFETLLKYLSLDRLGKKLPETLPSSWKQFMLGKSTVCDPVVEKEKHKTYYDLVRLNLNIES